jgi:PIN domain nuclease of toxin-antitoxin system
MRAAPQRLAARTRRLLTDPANDLLLSAASVWELAIKTGLGKVRLPQPLAEFVTSRVAEDGIVPLPVQHTHAMRVAELPLHHRDPFDRLLIAQAQVEALSLLTADRQLEAYDVAIIRA